MYKKLNVKIVMTLICLMFCLTMTGCSLRPNKPSAQKVEAVAKECINDKVTITDGKVVTENFAAGAYVWYPLVDERGINFNVAVDNSYVTIVEPIRPFYSKHFSYITDYKGKVIEHFQDEIADVLEKSNATKYQIHTEFNGGIEVDFVEGTNLSEIAETVMKINDIVAFDYRYNGDMHGKITNGRGAWWDGYCVYDILVRMPADKDGNPLIHDSFIFSDNNSTSLTYDKVLMVLEADKYSRENGEDYSSPIGLVMINGKIYKDTGEILEGYDENDFDVTTVKRVTNVPQNEGESNKGAGMNIKIIPDGNILVFHSDGAHVYAP